MLPKKKLQWLLEYVGEVCFLSLNGVVELEINMVLSITYLEFQTVYPLVATIHDSLEADGPCNWAGSTIDETPNLVKGRTLSVYYIGE